MILIWRFVNVTKIAKLTVRHYRAIYTTSMGFLEFFPYSIEIRPVKLPPIVLFEQIAKYLTHQEFHLYSTWNLKFKL